MRCVSLRASLADDRCFSPRTGNVLQPRLQMLVEIVLGKQETFDFTHFRVELYPLLRSQRGIPDSGPWSPGGIQTCLLTDCDILALAIPADINQLRTASTRSSGGANIRVTCSAVRCFP